MNRPDYEGLDGTGLPYVRPARIIGELPTPEDRRAALLSATQRIAERHQFTARHPINFGGRVHLAFGLTRPQAKNHPLAELLLTMGENLSLDHCPEYD